jgi:hypothetical protein
MRGHVSERYTSNKLCVECERQAERMASCVMGLTVNLVDLC